MNIDYLVDVARANVHRQIEVIAGLCDDRLKRKFNDIAYRFRYNTIPNITKRKEFITHEQLCEGIKESVQGVWLVKIKPHHELLCVEVYIDDIFIDTLFEDEIKRDCCMVLDALLPLGINYKVIVI